MMRKKEEPQDFVDTMDVTCEVEKTFKEVVRMWNIQHSYIGYTERSHALFRGCILYIEGHCKNAADKPRSNSMEGTHWEVIIKIGNKYIHLLKKCLAASNINPNHVLKNRNLIITHTKKSVQVQTLVTLIFLL